ncbi:MAG TPA: hypothetical protein VKA84_08200 [Gemmatimonadaceae bacterium]|nr:hypothetical protein [Gemmatimonadaceae bacterium]
MSSMAVTDRALKAPLGAVGSGSRGGRERSGRNAIERKAVLRVQQEIAAMPASLVVQLAIWPDHMAAWARAEGTSESVVYNMLARRKPYARVRERLARRLGVSMGVLAHLIEARRPLPASKRLPEPEGGVAPAAEPPPPIDWSDPPYPLHRDGTNPIERSAVRRVELEVASMPASAVVGLALWPLTLAEWSREQGFKESLVSATLAGSPSDRVRAALAKRLAVAPRELDHLIDSERREPRATLPPEPPPDLPPEPPAEAVAPPAPAPPPEPAPTVWSQLTLEL